MAILALAGWLALALVKARIDAGRDGGGLPVSHMAGTILLGMTAAVLIFSLARPAWGMSIYLHTNRDTMSPEGYRARLERASELNEHEPRILMALADSWRQTMTDSPAWSESNYLTVVRLYHDAEDLDPYDSNIPLHLADFRIRAERPAIDTLEEALRRMPKDTNLIKELLVEARRQKQPDLAYQMLQRGLMTDPADPWWWMQQAESALELGELPQAQRAIDIALTGDPDNAATVKAAWSAAHNALPALPPAG
jgi:tetratricopeptide (TPR) repeat protein